MTDLKTVDKSLEELAKVAASYPRIVNRGKTKTTLLNLFEYTIQVKSAADIAVLGNEKLLRVRGLGKKMVEAINYGLEELGLVERP